MAAITPHGAGSIEHAVNKQLSMEDALAEEFVDYSAVDEDEDQEEAEDGELFEEPPAPEGPAPSAGVQPVQTDDADNVYAGQVSKALGKVIDDDDEDSSDGDDDDDASTYEPPACPYFPGGKRSTVDLTILSWGDANKFYRHG
ncbi:MAG: hypothetical protein WCQ60_04090, partial [bacterium]